MQSASLVRPERRHNTSPVRTRKPYAPVLAIGALLAGHLFFAGAALGQGSILALESPSQFLGGCAPPSPCDCAVIFYGPVQGTFRLEPLPSTGFNEEFLVEDLDWQLLTAIPEPTIITGSGVYSYSPLDDTHSMSLDLLVNGELRTFTSGGFVPITADPFQIDVYEALDSCTYEVFSITAEALPQFKRGDCNVDGLLDISDPITSLGQLFSPGAAIPPCRDACDINDDGVFNVADPIYALALLFDGGPPPADPFPDCGLDPTEDFLDCFEYPGCP
ncbi:MAG: hypothetical protein AAF488_17030 [Planctomycetota bacterium]